LFAAYSGIIAADIVERCPSISAVSTPAMPASDRALSVLTDDICDVAEVTSDADGLEVPAVPGGARGPETGQLSAEAGREDEEIFVFSDDDDDALTPLFPAARGPASGAGCGTGRRWHATPGSRLRRSQCLSMYGTVCKVLPTKTTDASAFLEGMQRQEHAGIEHRAGREHGSIWLAP
jgi:hypothetical protein